MDMSKVAIVAALEREVRPLVRHWRVSEKEYGGRRFRFFENSDFILICGGIGAMAARRAAQAAIAVYSPSRIYSAGFAGALGPQWKIGDVLIPHRVINAGDGSSVTIEQGEGVLVTFASVASPEQKTKLRDSYAADAVDMEAAAVAQAAEIAGLRFVAVKAISDEVNFKFPGTERFIDSDGRFLEARFALYAAMRPWIWLSVIRLAKNSKRASRALCGWLENLGSKQNLDPTNGVRVEASR